MDASQCVMLMDGSRSQKTADLVLTHAWISAGGDADELLRRRLRRTCSNALCVNPAHAEVVDSVPIYERRDQNALRWTEAECLEFLGSDAHVKQDVRFGGTWHVFIDGVHYAWSTSKQRAVLKAARRVQLKGRDCEPCSGHPKYRREEDFDSMMDESYVPRRRRQPEPGNTYGTWKCVGPSGSPREWMMVCVKCGSKRILNESQFLYDSQHRPFCYACRRSSGNALTDPKSIHNMNDEQFRDMIIKKIEEANAREGVRR